MNNQYVKLVESTVSQKKLNDKLMTASEEGKLKLVKELVSKGADIHAANDWALRYASHDGHLDVVKYLVSQGADIYAFDDEALRWASNYGHTKVVNYLKGVIRSKKVQDILKDDEE